MLESISSYTDDNIDVRTTDTDTRVTTTAGYLHGRIALVSMKMTDIYLMKHLHYRPHTNIVKIPTI